MGAAFSSKILMDDGKDEMSMERAYFERMAQAYSAPDQEQYLRHVAEADALLRQHRELSVLGTIQSSMSIESAERRNKME